MKQSPAKMLWIVLAILLLYPLSGQQDIQRWAIDLTQSPQRYFNSEYERHIFEKFIDRQQPVQINGTTRSHNGITIQLLVSPEQIPYDIAFELDSENKIKHVYRSFLATDNTNPEQKANSRLRWLETFLYRLDAGDSASIKDLTFYQPVQLKYRHTSNKARAISRLMKDSPGVVSPSDFSLTERSDTLFIQITTQQLHALSITLPLRLLPTQDTSYLQDQLWKDVVRTDSTQPAILSQGKLIEQIALLYQDASVTDNAIHIPYPERKNPGVDKCTYARSPEGMNAVLSLEYILEKATLRLNDYAFKVYGPTTLDASKTSYISGELGRFYNSLLPDQSSLKARSVRVHYRAYNERQTKLTDTQWASFWQKLKQRNRVYAAPLQLNASSKFCQIRYMVWMTIPEGGPYYHYAELDMISAWDGGTDPVIKIVFYPYQRERELN